MCEPNKIQILKNCQNFQYKIGKSKDFGENVYSITTINKYQGAIMKKEKERSNGKRN